MLGLKLMLVIKMDPAYVYIVYGQWNGYGFWSGDLYFKMDYFLFLGI